MRVPTRVLLLIVAVLLTGLLGAATPASAYCDPVYYETTGRCTNGCVESARTFKKITGREAPWLCPM